MKTNARAARVRRHVRVRTKVRGTAGVPRLSVFRSLSNIYAQVIDDERGHTLASASSKEEEVMKAAETAAQSAIKTPAEGEAKGKAKQAAEGAKGKAKQTVKGEAKGKAKKGAEGEAKGEAKQLAESEAKALELVLS